MKNGNQSLIKTARILGYLGLLPFTLGLLALWLTEDTAIQDLVIKAILYYCAVILTFISAIHWGYILNNDQSSYDSKIIIVSVLPSLLAWLLLQASSLIALTAFFFAFIGWQQYEERIKSILNFPEWFQKLRKQLSYTVAALILMVWLMSLN